jgi:BlaI family transcriptional regulator, penicillinase repressor
VIRRVATVANTFPIPVRACQRDGTVMSFRLTRYELELMDVLWRLGEATVQDVCDGLERPLAYTTVMTTLRLLHGKKKVLRRIKRGRAHVYQPAVSRDDVSRSVMTDLQTVLFREQLPSLMLGLLEAGTFSSEDIQSLKAAIGRAESQER